MLIYIATRAGPSTGSIKSLPKPPSGRKPQNFEQAGLGRKKNYFKMNLKKIWHTF